MLFEVLRSRGGNVTSRKEGLRLRLTAQAVSAKEQLRRGFLPAAVKILDLKFNMVNFCCKSSQLGTKFGPILKCSLSAKHRC